MEDEAEIGEVQYIKSWSPFRIICRIVDHDWLQIGRLANGKIEKCLRCSTEKLTKTKRCEPQDVEETEAEQQ